MQITRDGVQGFIDGHKIAGHSKDCLKECLENWLRNHHTYKPEEEDILKILNSLESYK